ncbi:UNKNOWN [Stylonychia lemnae]|uniref:Uncharacterized protein n=1 Tax=Stylonychia lemnae TaxID=5949 RepID=A0A078AD37_STYLE|nr:UNKNOWN [Stylonychia lemnae]|eukprot:CDW80155.1 UNKNOWN [Stylonychia lemnae]
MKRLLQNLEQQPSGQQFQRPPLSRPGQQQKPAIQISKVGQGAANPNSRIRRQNSHLGQIAKNIMSGNSIIDQDAQKFNIQAIKENLIIGSNLHQRQSHSQNRNNYGNNIRGQQSKEIDFSGWKKSTSSNLSQRQLNRKPSNKGINDDIDLNLDQKQQQNYPKPQAPVQQLGIDTLNDYMKKQAKIQNKNSQAFNPFLKQQQPQQQSQTYYGQNDYNQNIQEDLFEDYESQQEFQMFQNQHQMNENINYSNPHEQQYQPQYQPQKRNLPPKNVAGTGSQSEREVFFKKLREAAQHINQN